MRRNDTPAPDLARRGRPSTVLTYFADDALKEPGSKVEGRLNPSGVKLAYEPAVGLLTGGPQAIHAQARTIRSILAPRPAADDTRPARSAANTTRISPGSSGT